MQPCTVLAGAHPAHRRARRPAGTSACANGYFYCRNVGHRPWWLSSLFVDDGVCDCCDGSDERSGCVDNCAAIGEAESKQLRETLAHFEAGAGVRGQLLEQAQQLRQQWAQEAADGAANVADLRPSLDALRGMQRCCASFTSCAAMQQRHIAWCHDSCA